MASHTQSEGALETMGKTMGETPRPRYSKRLQGPCPQLTAAMSSAGTKYDVFASKTEPTTDGTIVSPVSTFLPCFDQF